MSGGGKKVEKANKGSFIRRLAKTASPGVVKLLVHLVAKKKLKK
jgi:hypothetical protein